MPTAFDIVTIDTPDTVQLSAFWRDVLGLVQLEREDGIRWISIGTADGRRVMGFQEGAHHVGGTHIDLTCEVAEFESELARLVSLGAIAGPPRTEPYGLIVNLADPDGNPFDLCAYP